MSSDNGVVIDTTVQADTDGDGMADAFETASGLNPGDPADASIDEQTRRAWILYQRDGRHPWPVCGKYL